MNINKFLCKTFDSKKKGYITIKDIIFDVRIVMFFMFSWFVGIVRLVAEVFTTGYYSSTLEYLIVKPLLFGIPIITTSCVLIYITFKIIEYIIVPILEIKILRCPLKEDEKN